MVELNLGLEKSGYFILSAKWQPCWTKIHILKKKFNKNTVPHIHVVKTSERDTGLVLLGWAGQLLNLYKAGIFSQYAYSKGERFCRSVIFLSKIPFPSEDQLVCP